MKSAKDATENEKVKNQNEGEEKSFPVLSKQQHKSKTSIQRDFPRWLAEPKIINTKRHPLGLLGIWLPFIPLLITPKVDLKHNFVDSLWL